MNPYLNIEIFFLPIRYGMRRDISTSILSKALGGESANNYDWSSSQRRHYATDYVHKLNRKQYGTIGAGILIGLSGYAIYQLCRFNKSNFSPRY